MNQGNQGKACAQGDSESRYFNGTGFVKVYKGAMQVINEHLDGTENATAKAVWLALRQIENRECVNGEDCFTVSVSTIADVSNQGARTVKRRLADLCKIGLLDKQNRMLTGTSSYDTSVYTLRWGSDTVSPGLGHSDTRGSDTVAPYIDKEHSKEQSARPGAALPDVAIGLAEQLRDIVQTQKRIKVNSKKLKAWARDIDKLQRLDGVDFDRQKAAMDWYTDNAGGEYIPVIESGRSWREKFTKVEGAIERQGQASAGGNVPGELQFANMLIDEDGE